MKITHQDLLISLAMYIYTMKRVPHSYQDYVSFRALVESDLSGKFLDRQDGCVSENSKEHNLTVDALRKEVTLARLESTALRTLMKGEKLDKVESRIKIAKKKKLKNTSTMKAPERLNHELLFIEACRSLDAFEKWDDPCALTLFNSASEFIRRAVGFIKVQSDSLSPTDLGYVRKCSEFVKDFRHIDDTFRRVFEYATVVFSIAQKQKLLMAHFIGMVGFLRQFRQIRSRNILKRAFEASQNLVYDPLSILLDSIMGIVQLFGKIYLNEAIIHLLDNITISDARYDQITLLSRMLPFLNRNGITKAKVANPELHVKLSAILANLKVFPLDIQVYLGSTLLFYHKK